MATSLQNLLFCQNLSYRRGAGRVAAESSVVGAVRCGAVRCGAWGRGLWRSHQCGLCLLLPSVLSQALGSCASLCTISIRGWGGWHLSSGMLSPPGPEVASIAPVVTPHTWSPIAGILVAASPDLGSQQQKEVARVLLEVVGRFHWASLLWGWGPGGAEAAAAGLGVRSRVELTPTEWGTLLRTMGHHGTAMTSVVWKDVWC